MISLLGRNKVRRSFCPVRLNAGLKFPPRINLIFAQLLSSAFHVISCVIKKNGGQSSGRQLSRCKKEKKNIEKLCIRRAAAEPAARGSVLGGRQEGGLSAGRVPLPSGQRAPCPRCVSAQGGSASVATVASENSFRKEQADCQQSAEPRKAWRRLERREEKAPPLLRVSSASLADYVAARTLQVSGNFACSVFGESVLWF